MTTTRAKPRIKRTPLPTTTPAVQTSALPQGEYFDRLPLDQVGASPTNPRKTFDEEDLAELAASIKSHGVVQPIVVRPLGRYVVQKRKATLADVLGNDDKRPLEEKVAMWQVVYRDAAPGVDPVASSWYTEEDAHKELALMARMAKGKAYELVAGERRFRAAAIAGCTTIPARVIELDDAAACEIQLIENLQRKDLDALEEARGFQHAMTRLGWSAQQLADKVGKTVGYIYSSQKLLAIPAVAEKALRNGEATPELCKLIGRIPNVAARQEAAIEILGRRNGSPMTVKQAKELISREYMVELKKAVFDTKSSTLCIKAGSCEMCPKRTGNNPELYPDSRGDVCTDPSCFEAKTAAHGKKLLEQAKKDGHKVLAGGDKLFSKWGGHSLNYGTGYIDLDACCHEDQRMRHYRAVLGKELEKLKPFVLAPDQSGRVRELVPEAEAKKLLRKVLPKRPSSRSHHQPSARDRTEEQVLTNLRRRLMERTAEKVELMGSNHGWPKWLRPLLMHMVREIFWSPDEVLARRQLDVNQDLDVVLDGMQMHELFPFLAELAVWDGYHYRRPEDDRDNRDKHVTALLEALEIDACEIEKQVRDELKREAKPSSKPTKTR